MVAPIKITLLSATLDQSSHPPMWRVEQQLTFTDGRVETTLYLFPEDTIEWRMAEYGYDPDTDLDEVLEIVLLEPHVDPVPPDDPSHLFNASTGRAARARHRSLFQAHRGRILIEDSTDNPVQVPGLTTAKASKLDVRSALRQHSPISRDHLKVKAEHVDRVRRVRRDRSPRREGRETAAQLRRRLDQEEG